jgi:hypothetical protein
MKLETSRAMDTKAVASRSLKTGAGKTILINLKHCSAVGFLETLVFDLSWRLSSTPPRVDRHALRYFGQPR